MGKKKQKMAPSTKIPNFLTMSLAGTGHHRKFSLISDLNYFYFSTLISPKKR